MKNFRAFVISTLFVCFVVISANNAFTDNTNSNILGNREPKTNSDRAILEIEKIVTTFTGEGKDLTDRNVQNEIIEQVDSSFPLNTDSKLEQYNLSKVEEKTDLAADKKYPLTREELKKKYSIEVDEKNKPLAINSTVTVEFKQGPYLHKVTGEYYGYTAGNDGIRVGRTIIPIMDLSAKDKIRFDKKYGEQQKEDYINKKIVSYLSIKREYALKQIRSSIDAVDKKNEESGYIHAWQKWRKPQEVAEIIIKHYSSNSSNE